MYLAKEGEFYEPTVEQLSHPSVGQEHSYSNHHLEIHGFHGWEGYGRETCTVAKAVRLM